MNMPQVSKSKCISSFRKCRKRKKFNSGGVKMAKSKLKKTEELIAGYEEAECN